MNRDRIMATLAWILCSLAILANIVVLTLDVDLFSKILALGVIGANSLCLGWLIGTGRYPWSS